MRSLANAELFKLYDSEFVLHLHNTKNMTDTRKILAHLQLHLAEYPPSLELAKGFCPSMPTVNPAPSTATPR